jgi:hypothetical protein
MRGQTLHTAEAHELADIRDGVQSHVNEAYARARTNTGVGGEDS